MTTLLDRLNRRNLTRVICIDDENAVPPLDNIDRIYEAFATLSIDLLNDLPDVDTVLADVLKTRRDMADNSLEEILASIRPIIDDLFDSGSLTGNVLSALARKKHDGGATATALREMFNGVEFLVWSFSDWQDNQQSLMDFTADGQRLLLLVDEMNEHEPAVDVNGEKVIQSLFTTHLKSMHSIDCIVVTANCVADKELEESHRLYKSIKDIVRESAPGQPLCKVFVIAKERLSHDTLNEEFLTHLDRIEVAHLTMDMTSAVRRELEKGVQEALDFLDEIPLQDFHSTVFESSMNEGASELETLLRLVGIKQRSALATVLKSDGLVKQIQNLRGYTREHLGVAEDAALGDLLRSLRVEEFERSGAEVNSLLTPIACGDVFEISTKLGKKTKSFTGILLANPCDLTIRANGARKLNTGFIVEIRKDQLSKIKEAETENNLNYVIATGQNDDQDAYLFLNSKIEAIPLSILDLCSFNSDGSAKLDPKDATLVYASLLPGLQQKLLKLLTPENSGVFPTAELFGRTLEVMSTVITPVEISGVTSSTTTEYKIKRVWRLAPEFASAALLTLSQAIARPGFGHDFTRKGKQKPRPKVVASAEPASTQALAA